MVEKNSSGFGFLVKWEKYWRKHLKLPIGHDKLSWEETLQLQVFPDVGEIAQFARLAYAERSDIFKFLKGTHLHLKG